MRSYLARRVLQSAVLFVLITMITFTVIRLAPGGPAILANPNLTKAQMTTLRAGLGLEDPIPVVPAGNGLSTARTSPPQISVTRPLTKIRSPIVTITTRRTEPFSLGRMIAWWTAAPPRNDTASVNANAGQYPQPWFAVSVQAT